MNSMKTMTKLLTPLVALLVALVVMMLGSNNVLAAETQVVKADPANGAVVAVNARYVFAPKGFDDNDETVVTIDGYLPSGCYRLVRPEVDVNRESKVITVTPVARFFDVPCVEALIPYNVEVHLGVLPIGAYTVQAGKAPVSESLEIGEATNAGPDDFLYAPVDEVTVERDDTTGSYTAVLKGRFTNSCMAFEDVIIEDNGKSVNVLPVIAMNQSECTSGEFPFRREVELPESVDPGRHLLHVRSLNGRAINYLFNVVGR